MSRFFTVFLLVCGLILVGLPPQTAAATNPNPVDLAYRWAPIHYQDTDSSDYDADYLSAINFDGDWDTLNNWENQRNTHLLGGAVYYSIVETRTHWFITYAFYHPRDWSDILGSTEAEHENDLEGALLTVRKDGSPYGSLEAMVTVFHSDFYSYTPASSRFSSGEEDIDGKIVMQIFEGVARPTTFQEAKGHGAKAWNGKNFPGGDGIVYYPSRTTSEVPSGGNDRSVSYTLIDMLAPGEIWDRRYETQLFARWGTFRGDNGKDNAAHAPWAWNDHNDNHQLTGGELATDPARLIDIYFDNVGNFSRYYTNNTFAPNPSMQPDLFAIQDHGTASSAVEVTTLSAIDSYQSLSGRSTTIFPQTGPTQLADYDFADYNRDGRLDLYIILKEGTGSNQTEVHILDGATNYQTFLLNVAVPIPVTGSDGGWTFATGYYDGDDTPDVFGIKKQGVNSTEVHILSGNTNYTQFVLQVGSALHHTDISWDFEVGDLNRDGIDDIYAIRKVNNGLSQVHVLSGGAHFQQFMIQVEIPLANLPADGSWMFTVEDYNADGWLDLYAIDKTDDTSIVYVFDGTTYFQTQLGLWPTPAGPTGSDWSWEWES